MMRTLMALVIGAAAIAPSMSASAAEMYWNFRNNYPYTVDIQVYAPDRNNFWPTASTVWTHGGSDVRRYGISCHDGEKVCYGASPRGNYSRYWGSGIHNTQYCDSCCYTCVDGFDTPVINLNNFSE